MRRARLGLLACVLALPAAAAPDVIYRCVAADGRVLLQNTARCPKGMREERRVIERPAPAPALPTTRPVATPAPVVPAGPAPAASGPGTPAPSPPTVDATAALRPAPALMACRTREGETYFSDDPLPSRCVPLRTVGLDGRSPSAAEACERVFDACEPVAEAARCDAWAGYRRQAESVAAFQPGRAEDAAAVLARIDRALAGTACAR